MTENEAYIALTIDTVWEIDQESLEINRKLGEGAFGAVFGADAYDVIPGQKCTAVAVKTLRADADDTEKVRKPSSSRHHA